MTEDKVDVIIGPTITPAAIAIIPVVAEGKTPNISQGPTNSVVQPVDEHRRWVFKTTTNDEHEATPMFNDMRKKDIKSLAYIGFADGLGDQWDKLVTRYTAAQNGAPEIKVVARERYARADTSVTAQVVKMLAQNPDAVLIAGSGAGAATPLLELRKRGYKKDIYVILGATFGEFLKISGPAAEGIYAPFAAVMGVDQVPDSYEAKKSAQQFVALYDAKYGKNASNIFAAGGWDATKLIESAAPVALKKAQPGTPEFRAALRDAIENIRNLDGARGRYNMSTTDHAGLDSNALMLGQFRNGRWNLVKP
jgi:branched-chain amino acid transport system substrate-binding protein